MKSHEAELNQAASNCITGVTTGLITINNNIEQVHQPKVVYKPCRNCGGVGKLKAGQLAIDPSSGRTVQAPYTLVNCKKCGGFGYEIIIK